MKGVFKGERKPETREGKRNTQGAKERKGTHAEVWYTSERSGSNMLRKTSSVSCLF